MHEVARIMGTDRVLFGSDWPFEMGLPEPSKLLQKLDPGLRENIMKVNSQSLIERMGLERTAS